MNWHLYLKLKLEFELNFALISKLRLPVWKELGLDFIIDLLLRLISLSFPSLFVILYLNLYLNLDLNDGIVLTSVGKIRAIFYGTKFKIEILIWD